MVNDLKLIVEKSLQDFHISWFNKSEHKIGEEELHKFTLETKVMRR